MITYEPFDIKNNNLDIYFFSRQGFFWPAKTSDPLCYTTTFKKNRYEKIEEELEMIGPSILVEWGDD